MRFSLLLAYIDPVSGVILLQLLIGGVIGCFARFRHQIWRIICRLMGKSSAETKPEENPIPPFGQPLELPVAAEVRSIDSSPASKEIRKAA
jgi:hypothetical protein